MKVIIGIVFISIALIIGCSDDTTGPQNGKGELKVYMVDSPSVYDSVVVCISSVEIHKAGSSETSGWAVLNDSTRYFDLLQLSNGANVILGDKNLDEGHYTQIRLLITSDSYIVTQGIKVNLNIPSGMQTGIKLNHQFTIDPGITYSLMLDFDAERSVQFLGNGMFILSPVIRVMPVATSGTISGQVLPLDAMVNIWATSGSDTISTFPNESGFFKLMALPEGVFNVNFMSDNSTYADTTISGVQVTAGMDTDMGVITLSGN